MNQDFKKNDTTKSTPIDITALNACAIAFVPTKKADPSMSVSSITSFVPTNKTATEGHKSVNTAQTPASATQQHGNFAAVQEFIPTAFVPFDDQNGVDIKFKTELCKNFSETGYCRYGDNCQFAHGVHDLARTCRQEMEAEVKNYKTQKCRQFWKEMFCKYGERCHFRHEQRSFQKLHRYFYCQHLLAIRYKQEQYLAE